MVNRETTSIRLKPEVSTKARNYADENNMLISELFENAVLEYMDADRMSRLEDGQEEILSKIDSFLPDQGEGRGGPSEQSEEKKKNISSDSRDSPAADNVSHADESSSTPDEEQTAVPDGGAVDTVAEGSASTAVRDPDAETLPAPADVSWPLSTDLIEDLEQQYDDSTDEFLQYGPLAIEGKQTEGRANRMVNYLLLKYPDAPIIGEAEIERAITTICGDSDHYLKKYPELIQSRLQNLGWSPHPVKEAMYRDSSQLLSHLQHYWQNAKSALGDDPLSELGPDQVKEMVENSSQIKDALVSRGIDDAAEIQQTLSEYERRFEGCEPENRTAQPQQKVIY